MESNKQEREKLLVQVMRHNKHNVNLLKRTGSEDRVDIKRIYAISNERS